MSLDNATVKESNNLLKIVILGVGVWLIPFLFSFLFYTPQGTLLISEGFFNSIMSVVLAFMAALAVIYYFKTVSRDFMKEAVWCGIAWFAISIILDLVILVPMAKLEVAKYFSDIALGYVVIPIMAVLVGMLLNDKHSHSKRIYGQIISSKKD